MNQEYNTKRIFSKYDNTEEGDWDDILSPDDYEEMLERKQYERMMRRGVA